MTDTTEQAPPANVIQAVARVEAEIGGIRRLTPTQRAQLGLGGGGDSGISYAYRGIDSIASEAQPLFGKYGVVIVPDVLDVEVEKILKGANANMETTAWRRMTVEVRWTIYGPGGVEDRITSTTVGVADDNSDKHMNKSMTAAFKNLLLRILCIGDPQDDTDNYGAEGSEAAPRGQAVIVNAPPATLDELNDLVKGMKPAQKTKLNRYAGLVLGVKNFSEPGDKTSALAQAARNLLAGRECDDNGAPEPEVDGVTAEPSALIDPDPADVPAICADDAHDWGKNDCKICHLERPF